MVGIVKLSDTGKPGPNVQLVTNAVKILLVYGHFTWAESDGFKITRHDSLRLQTFIDDAVKAGRLTKGSWRKRTWLGFVTLSQMVRAFLEHYLDKGCVSWDIIVAKCLAVTLVGALGCRSGDLALSPKYENLECLLFRHIQLTIEGETTNLRNVRGVITLESTKGFKDVRNADVVHYLRPLDETESQHVCPIIWLLVHALRNGLVYGNTLPEVLDRAFIRPDRLIEWTQPTLPVLPAFTHDSSIRCDLAKPARPGQLLATIKQMGLVSNILCRVYTHATRLGAIRDIAHLPKSNETFGYVTDEHRQVMQHSTTSFSKGLTENYVGGHTQELYNARAANKSKPHRREPRFSSTSAMDLVKAPVTDQEVREWKERNEPSSGGQGKKYKDSSDKIRIRKIIRRERLASFEMNAEPENPFQQKPEPRNLVTLASRTASAINARQLPPSTVSVPTNSEIPTHTNIDPALFEDDSFEQIQVPAMDLHLLHTTLFATQGDELSEATLSGPIGHNDITSIEEEGDRILLGADDGTKAPSAESFIDNYARINVVNSTTFARKWPSYSSGKPFDDTIGLVSVRGHSRDDPTPYIYRCQKTPNCPFQTTQKRSLGQHQDVCSEALAETIRERQDGSSHFKCPREGCHSTFTSQKTLNVHIKGTHDWAARPCEHGCDPLTIYTTKHRYEEHRIARHSGRWPSSCLYPGCESATSFKSQSSLSYHLASAHNITDKTEQRRYLPSLPSVLRWVKQICIIDGCESKVIWARRSKMLAHLTSKQHNMTAEDANALIDEKTQFETIVRESRVLNKSRKRDVYTGEEGERAEKAADQSEKKRLRGH